jgi:hypothetical protein
LLLEGRVSTKKPEKKRREGLEGLGLGDKRPSWRRKEEAELEIDPSLKQSQ